MKQEQQYIWIDNYGNKFHYKDREMKIRHRLDGPAVECLNGSKYWYVDDKCHRLDGPAVEFADGAKYWYVDDKRHRLDGPACEFADGDKYWYVDDKRHRTNGPAVEYTDGRKYWYVDGECFTEEQFLALSTPLELTLEDIASKYGVDVSKVKIKK
jgi:hypothetical protein